MKKGDLAELSVLFFILNPFWRVSQAEPAATAGHFRPFFNPESNINVIDRIKK